MESFTTAVSVVCTLEIIARSVLILCHGHGATFEHLRSNSAPPQQNIICTTEIEQQYFIIGTKTHPQSSSSCLYIAHVSMTTLTRQNPELNIVTIMRYVA